MMKKMPLFGVKHRSPHEVVKTLSDSLLRPSEEKEDMPSKKVAKMQEEINRCIASMKASLIGSSGEQDGGGWNDSVANLVTEVHNSRLLFTMIENFGKIDFESRKDVVSIFVHLLRRKNASTNTYPSVDHIFDNREVLDSLLVGYKDQDYALSCGVVLRECFKHLKLVELVMDNEIVYQFFDYVDVPTFDISSDAFLTFRELLTNHKVKTAAFIGEHYERFFECYHKLLSSDNYVTRRQALKLLGELLLDRSFFDIMTRYITSPDNLLMVMNMLKESSKNIQFEAFHVFKVFVANPDKPSCINDILLRRREKLLEFLARFHPDRSEDEQFNDEKAYLIKHIKELKASEDKKQTSGSVNHIPSPEVLVDLSPPSFNEMNLASQTPTVDKSSPPIAK